MQENRNRANALSFPAFLSVLRSLGTSNTAGIKPAARRAVLAAEIHGDGVAAADDNADLLSGLDAVAAGKDGRRGCGAARFGHDAEHTPKRPLSVANVIVGDEHHALDVALGDGKH